MLELAGSIVMVDEKGTEAAAASASTSTRAGGMAAPFCELIADRPFLFFIRDLRSRAILFMGRVADPATSRLVRPRHPARRRQVAKDVHRLHDEPPPVGLGVLSRR